MRPQGRLDPLASGYSAPIDSPLYERRPSGWVYRDTQFTAVTFETNEEAVLDILPAPLRPAHTPPRATIVVLECRDSTFGAYDEIKFEVAVELGGKVFRYCPYIMVGALDGTLAPDAAMAMGREVLGVPKKIGRIRVRREADQVAVSLERPIGTAIVTVSVSPREAVSPAEAGLATDTPVVHLRLIPSVAEVLPPSRARPLGHREARRSRARAARTRLRAVRLVVDRGPLAPPARAPRPSGGHVPRRPRHPAHGPGRARVHDAAPLASPRCCGANVCSCTLG